jgi:hypothetical protein
VASVKRWILAGLVGCVAVALAYLPPRGATPRDGSIFVSQSRRGTPARQRAQAVADEWRAADASLRLLRARRQLQAVLQEAKAGTSLVVVSESAEVMTAAAPVADSAIHLAWRQLGLGETKVRVAVIIELAASSQMRARPLLEAGVATYLAPDSADRTTCVAVLPAGTYWTRVFRGDLRDRPPLEAVVRFFEAGLGPCAFYAAYGTPSKSVRGWLVSHQWDLALTLDAGARRRQANSLIGMADPRYPWFWDAIYSLPPTAVACLASRPAGCSAAVLSGAGDDPAVPLPDITRVDRRWGRVPRLVEGQRFLGDVARTVGRDRFLGFWTSPLPVDTALAAALKRPVGEWTADWQRDFVRPVRLGPAAPLGGVATAFGLAALALALVAVTASRRQVR